MSSEKTTELDLHKWAATDYVQRTEFNDNFAKIDEHAAGVTTQLEHIAVNPREFGAKGDRTIDDTQAFLDAIAALSSKSGKFTVSTGEYLVDPVLVFTNMQNLQIEFLQGAVLICRQTGSTNKAVMTLESVNKASITGLSIDGNNKAWYGLDISKCNNVKIDTIEIKKTLLNSPMRGDGSGLRILTSNFVYVLNSKFTDISSDGILTLGSNYVIIDGCHAERCLRHNYAFAEPVSRYCVLRNSFGKDSYLSGIDMESGQFCKIVDNHFLNNGSYEHTTEGTHPMLRNAITMMAESYSNIVRGNIIDKSKNHGVFLVQPTNAARTVEGFVQTVADIIEGNIIRRTGMNGVFLSGAQNQENNDTAYSVMNNIIEDCPVGVYLGYTTKDAIISFNQIHRCTMGIQSNTATRLTVNSNKIRDAKFGIRLGDTQNSVISSNTIDLIDATGQSSKAEAIRIYNGGNSLERIVIVDNITNVNTNLDQLLIYLYGSAGHKNVEISRNVSKFGVVAELFYIWISGLTVNENSRITHSNYEFFTINNAWRSIGNLSTTTAGRQKNPTIGFTQFDSTLQKPIWWTGTAWVDSVGTII